MDKSHYENDWVLLHQWKLENCSSSQCKSIYGLCFKLNYNLGHGVLKKIGLVLNLLQGIAGLVR